MASSIMWSILISMQIRANSDNTASIREDIKEEMEVAVTTEGACSWVWQGRGKGVCVSAWYKMDVVV